MSDWLKGISRRTDLSIQLDDEGVFAVGHVAGLDCAVEVPGNGSIYLRVPLMPWDSGAHPHIAERCLAEHFLGGRTNGGCFAIDREDAELVIWKECFLAGLDEARLALQIAGLLETAVEWRDKLSGAHDEPAPTDSGLSVLIAGRV